MRPTHFITSALLAGALLTAGCGGEDNPEPRPAAASRPAFTSTQVTGFFRAVTGDPLRAEPSGSYDLVTIDRGDYVRSSRMRERYGSFMILVLRGRRAEHVYKRDDGTPITPDEHGIYWHDEDGTWEAMKPYRNVVLAWSADEQTVDERFERLDTVLSQLGKPADQVRAALPASEQPCAGLGAGTCRDAGGATVTTVERSQRLELPNLQVKIVKVQTGPLVIPPRGDDYTRPRRAKGRFVLVAVRLKNTGNEALRGLYDARLKIGERVYDQDTDANFTVTPFDAFPIQPDDTGVAAVVFDVPVSAARKALDEGVLAFPAGAEPSTVEEAGQIGQIRLARTAATNA